MRETSEVAVFDARPLILTAQLDAATFALADGLRQQHFPRERNFLAAHLTLFHALPAKQLDAVVEALAGESATASGMELTLTAPMPLGSGVALAVHCESLGALRSRLRAHWLDHLTSQDRAGWRPHITVQNKVKPAQARALLEDLNGQWRPVGGVVTGLCLWRYDGGPWVHERTFALSRSTTA
jgi:hypothetical protein